MSISKHRRMDDGTVERKREELRLLLDGTTSVIDIAPLNSTPCSTQVCAAQAAPAAAGAACPRLAWARLLGAVPARAAGPTQAQAATHAAWNVTGYYHLRHHIRSIAYNLKISLALGGHSDSALQVSIHRRGTPGAFITATTCRGGGPAWRPSAQWNPPTLPYLRQLPRRRGAAALAAAAAAAVRAAAVAA